MQPNITKIKLRNNFEPPTTRIASANCNPTFMSKINKKVKLHQKTNWKSLSNEDLEKEYNPSSLIGGNYQPYIEQYIAQSEIAKNQLDLTDCQYGPKSSNTINLFIPKSASREKPCPLI